MRVTTLLLLLLLITTACGGPDYDSTLEKVRATGVLVVGTEPEFPPFESRNERGELVGFDMDMVRAIAQDLGVELKIEPMAFDSLPSALATGKIDLIASGMTATPERAKSRAFTKSYYRTRLCLLVHKDSGIEDPKKLGAGRLVVKLGTTGDINAPTLFPDAKITRLEAEGACALEVIQGRADAFLYDQHSIERHHEAHPESTRALLEPLTDEPYAMAVRFGDDAFVAWLNEFLGRYHKDGRYARSYETHFGYPPSAPQPDDPQPDAPQPDDPK